MNDTKITRKEDAERADVPTMLPAVDVVEDAGGITLYADLPGVQGQAESARRCGRTLHRRRGRPTRSGGHGSEPC